MEIHRFEHAGLGKAPYKFVGYSREIFQAVPGDPNCPIQPGTSCDFCATGIMDVFWFVSADGKRFKVGSDCVKKAGGSGLVRAIAPEIRRQQHGRDDARIQAAISAIDSVRERLATQPHPYKFMADRGHTALSFVEFNLKNAGRAGKIKAARLIEAASKAS